MRKILFCYILILFMHACASAQTTDIVYTKQIETGYKISSVALIGGNSVINVINIYHFNSPAKTKTVAKIGLVLGMTQALSGVFSFKRPDYYTGVNAPIKVIYRSQNNLSYINICLGSATVLTSAYNLFMNKKERKKSVAYSFFSYTNQLNHLTAGVSFSKKF